MKNMVNQNRFSRFKSGFINSLEAICGVMLAVLMIVVFLGVMNRFIFRGLNLTWTQEIGRFLMIWVSMLAAGIAVGKHEHYVIDFLVNKFVPPTIKAQGMHGIIVSISSMAILVPILSKAIYLPLRNLAQIAPASGMPMAIMYSAIPIGLGLIIFFLILDVIERSITLKCKDEQVPKQDINIDIDANTLLD